MASYKILKNIARNFAHSFMSMMNFEDGFYITDVIAREMYIHNLSEIQIDIMIGEVLQEQMRHPLITMSVACYSEDFFPRMLEKEGFTSETIQSAVLKIHYDFERYTDDSLHYQAIMIIKDDRGKIHQGEVLGNKFVSSSFFDEDFSCKTSRTK